MPFRYTSLLFAFIIVFIGSVYVRGNEMTPQEIFGKDAEIYYWKYKSSLRSGIKSFFKSYDKSFLERRDMCHRALAHRLFEEVVFDENKGVSEYLKAVVVNTEKPENRKTEFFECHCVKKAERQDERKDQISTGQSEPETDEKINRLKREIKDEVFISPGVTGNTSTMFVAVQVKNKSAHKTKTTSLHLQIIAHLVNGNVRIKNEYGVVTEKHEKSLSLSQATKKQAEDAYDNFRKTCEDCETMTDEYGRTYKAENFCKSKELMTQLCRRGISQDLCSLKIGSDIQLNEDAIKRMSSCFVRKIVYFFTHLNTKEKPWFQEWVRCPIKKRMHPMRLTLDAVFMCTGKSEDQLYLSHTISTTTDIQLYRFVDFSLDSNSPTSHSDIENKGGSSVYNSDSKHLALAMDSTIHQ